MLEVQSDKFSVESMQKNRLIDSLYRLITSITSAQQSYQISDALVNS